MTAAGTDLYMARREAETLMTETVTVGRYTDTTHPTTGDPVRTLTTSRYSGKGKIRYRSNDTQARNAAGGPVAAQEPVLSIPSGSARCFEGDEVVVSASTSDGLLVGRRYKITGTAIAGQTSAHRYPLVELS